MRCCISKLKAAKGGGNINVEIRAEKPFVFEGYEASCGLKGVMAGFGYAVLFKGTLTADVQARCARCLTECGFPFQADVILRISDSLNELTKSLTQDESDFFGGDYREVFIDVPLGEFLSEGDMFDFEPIAKGIIEADVPFSVLCEEDCKGLCPRCGANLNETDCNCRNENEYSAFADLKTLLNNEEM